MLRVQGLGFRGSGFGLRDAQGDVQDVQGSGFGLGI